MSRNSAVLPDVLRMRKSWRTLWRYQNPPTMEGPHTMMWGNATEWVRTRQLCSRPGSPPTTVGPGNTSCLQASASSNVEWDDDRACVHKAFCTAPGPALPWVLARHHYIVANYSPRAATAPQRPLRGEGRWWHVSAQKQLPRVMGDVTQWILCHNAGQMLV